MSSSRIRSATPRFQAYSEEVVRFLDIMDAWAEGIAMDRSDHHEGRLFDIDLRAGGQKGRTYV
ncbi:hypothetical protein IWX63_002676 [Arthrobacter sp. CAN_A2]|uniref:hypothetical protein n=1 Tax=Arthrobacter sp. CAN_A2 TaxID=2787718 RepID=UPI0018F03B59